ncbi:MAG: TonB-dependent receptor, partial [Acidobacteriota bacterium]
MWIRLTLSVFVALTLAGEAAAQCKVEGVVRNLTGAPIEGATVVLDPPVRKTVTDAAGHYVFDEVAAGSRVKLAVMKDGRQIAWEFSLVTRFVEQVDLAERSVAPLSMVTAFNDVRGVVRSAGGRPVAAATVAVDEPATIVTTDAAGRYVLPKMPSGAPVLMRAGAPGFDSVMQEVVVPAKQVLDLDFNLDTAKPAPAKAGSGSSAAAKPSASAPALADPDTARLEAAKPEAADDLSSSTLGDSDARVFRPGQTKGIPSLIHNDVFRAVQLMPGVEAAQEASSGLMVRGGTPGQTLVTLDGITLYDVDHLFGFYSAVNMEGIRTAEFAKSNDEAGDGGRLSGVLRLTGESRTAAGPTGFVEMSSFGLGGLVSIPLGSRVSLLVAGRRSNPTTLFNKAFNWMDIGGAQASRGLPVAYSGGVLRAPVENLFHDLNGTFLMRPSDRDQLSVTAFDANTVLDSSHNVAWINSAITAPISGQLLLPSNAVSHSADVRNSISRGVGGHWSHQWSSSTSTTLTAGRSTYTDHRDRASTLVDPASGIDYSLLAGRGGNDASSEATDIRDTTVRLEALIAPGFSHALSVGGEISALDIGYTANREVITARRSNLTYSEQLAPFLNRADSARVMTFFAQDAWRPTSRVTLSPGVRVARYDVTNTSYVEPRLNASIQVASRVRLNGGWSVDHQFANRVTREDFVRGDSAFWTLADGTTVPVARSQQVFGGGSIETANVVADVQAYYRELNDETMFAPRLIAGAPMASGTTGMHIGSGTARGVELLLRQRSSANNAWISYTLSKVERTFPTLEAATFAGSEDRPHEIKVADTARLGAHWSVGGAWVWASGQPVTPVTGVVQAWWPTGLVVYQPTYGPKNSDRVTAYHRLDLSTQCEFTMAR